MRQTERLGSELSGEQAEIQRYFGLPIVWSTLTVPRLPNRFTSRPRLVGELIEDSRQCCVIHAPAGYGKTTAIIEALAERKRNDVAWLSIDAYESTELSFWAHLAASIDRVRPGFFRRLAISRLPVSPGAGVTLPASLLSAFNPDDSLVIVLDDIHHVRSRTLWDQIAFFVDRLPPGVRTIISSRSVPPLPIERWETQGRANVFDEGTLRFSTEEATELLAKVGDEHFTPDEVHTLVSLSEGWAVGLVFEALAWRSSPSTSTTKWIRRPTRNVIRYLATEVFEKLARDDRQFLLDISVLDEFDDELCRAVTGEADAGIRLQYLQVANVFLVPVGEDGRRFRFHHLFRELLLRELDTRDPNRRIEIHRRAAEAADSLGMVAVRIHHLLEMGEKDAAFDLMVAHAVRQGSLVTARELIASFPNEFVHEHPARMLDFALIHSYAGNWDTAEVWCDRANAIIGNSTGPLRARLELHKAWKHGGHGEAQDAIDALDRCFGAGASEDDGPLAALYRTSGARLHVMVTRDLRAARFWLDLARELPPHFPHAHQGTIPALTAMLRLWAGEVDDAERLARQVLAAASDMHLPYGIPSLEALLALWDVLLETARLSEAASVGEEAEDLALQLAPPIYLAHVALRRIELIAATQGPAAALEEAARARRELRSKCLGESLTSELMARHAYWLLYEGHDVDASKLIERLNPSPARAILRAKLDANDPCRHVTVQGSEVDWTASERLEAALIRAATRDYQSLPDILDGANGLVWTVVKQGPSLLRRLSLLSHDPDSAITGLLDEAKNFHPAFWQYKVSTSGSNLTQREQTLLRLLPSHLSYAEIASELYLSVNTVKANLKMLYRKLGASSRSEAVEKARHLLPSDEQLKAPGLDEPVSLSI